VKTRLLAASRVSFFGAPHQRVAQDFSALVFVMVFVFIMVLLTFLRKQSFDGQGFDS
jgi:hypothetical protein